MSYLPPGWEHSHSTPPRESVPVVEVFGRRGAVLIDKLQAIMGTNVLGIVCGRFGDREVTVYWHPELADETIAAIEQLLCDAPTPPAR